MRKIEFDGFITASDRDIPLKKGSSFENTQMLVEGIVCEVGSGKDSKPSESQMLRWEAFGAYVGGNATLIEAGRIAGMSGPGFREVVLREKVNEVKRALGLENVDDKRFGAKPSHHESYEGRRRKRAKKVRKEKAPKVYPKKHEVLLDPKTSPKTALDELTKIRPGSGTFFRKEINGRPAILVSVQRFAREKGLSLRSQDTAVFTEYLIERGVIAGVAGDKGYFKSYNIWSLLPENLERARLAIEDVKKMGGVSSLASRHEVSLEPDSVDVIRDRV